MEGEDELTSFEVIHLPDPDPRDPATVNPEQREKSRIRAKLLSAWNKLKYEGWPAVKGRSALSKSGVCLSGELYQLRCKGERERFRRSFTSLLWLTYRRGFPPLPGSALRSDAGWGCMLRSAQMMLARALVLHFLSAEWTWPATHGHTKDDLELLDSRLTARDRRCSLEVRSEVEGLQDHTHRMLVSWFSDLPSSPFGLHRLVELGQRSGRTAGDWYGPALAAHILQRAVSSSALLNLAVYVAQDCTVYTGDVLQLCSASGWRPVVLLVPVRLGSDVLNHDYIPCVKRVLELKSCLGIIGGKPRHSLFFVGFQDEELIYLDPHYCQPTVDVRQAHASLESYHCRTVRKMAFRRMDPSCTVGFYAASRDAFLTLCTEVTQALASSGQTYPFFSVVSGVSEAETHVTDTQLRHSSADDEFELL